VAARQGQARRRGAHVAPDRDRRGLRRRGRLLQDRAADRRGARTRRPRRSTRCTGSTAWWRATWRTPSTWRRSASRCSPTCRHGCAGSGRALGSGRLGWPARAPRPRRSARRASG
jgi:hypothetical protein